MSFYETQLVNPRSTLELNVGVGGPQELDENMRQWASGPQWSSNLWLKLH